LLELIKMKTPITDLSGNQLLSEILERTGSSLIPHLERVTLDRQQVIHEANYPIRHVYFPIDALVSLVYVMENGSSAEAAMVGNDGIVGVAPIMGSDSMPYGAVVQCPGEAFRLRASLLSREAGQLPALQHTLMRYTQSLLTQMAQNAACSRHHSLYQQLCRWLLLSIDRLPSPELPMTQEGISHMLGVRRESITVAAHQLQEAGIIRYSRGRIHVIDRAKLERSSCECYGVVRREVNRLQAMRLPASSAIPAAAARPTNRPAWSFA
jgi:CRP-like cAMP-binding protein